MRPWMWVRGFTVCSVGAVRKPQLYNYNVRGVPNGLSLFPGCSHLQYTPVYCKQSNTGGGNGLGMRLPVAIVRVPIRAVMGTLV